MHDLILYTSDDGQVALQLRASDGTVWLSQLEIAELFASSKQNISLHIRNILAEGELADSVVKESLTVRDEGGQRLKNPGGWDYFDELLERIREIRASEKRLYQKIRDLYTTAVDYQGTSEAARLFFQQVQSKMLRAVTAHTAADLQSINACSSNCRTSAPNNPYAAQ